MESTEVKIYRRLATGPEHHIGKHHIPKLLHSFVSEGPNGMHACLATELLGPSVPIVAERYSDTRLPGRVAWQAVRQATHALAYMHGEGITHGGSFVLSFTIFREWLTDNEFTRCAPWKYLVHLRRTNAAASDKHFADTRHSQKRRCACRPLQLKCTKVHGGIRCTSVATQLE